MRRKSIRQHSLPTKQGGNQRNISMSSNRLISVKQEEYIKRAPKTGTTGEFFDHKHTYTIDPFSGNGHTDYVGVGEHRHRHSIQRFVVLPSKSDCYPLCEDNTNAGLHQHMIEDNKKIIIPAAGDAENVANVDINYILSFTGDTNVSTRRGDLVATDFNPDTFDLPSKGFTISYWVRPDEVGSDMFAIGRKAHNNERFTFGMSRKNKGYFGVGANQSERAWSTMLDEAGMDKATHLTQDTDDEWILTVGKWYHFVVTYAGTNAGTNNMLRKIYMNGQQIWGTGVSDPDNKGNIAWSQTGTEMSKGLSFGMRAVRGSGGTASYNNGWACGLDEVAIYDTAKDSDFIANVYNGGTNYNHTGNSNLVGYWKFNEGSGTTVADLSGNGNHGLLTNDSHGDDGGAAFASGLPTWEEIEGY